MPKIPKDIFDDWLAGPKSWFDRQFRTLHEVRVAEVAEFGPPKDEPDADEDAAMAAPVDAQEDEDEEDVEDDEDAAEFASATPAKKRKQQAVQVARQDCQFETI